MSVPLYTWTESFLVYVRYVYQKAYVEFFVSPEKLEGLEQRLKSKSSITYMAINSKGQVGCSTALEHTSDWLLCTMSGMYV